MIIENLIGASTHFMPSTYGETLEDAVRLLEKSDIRAFEIVPVKYQAQIGWPYNIPNVGLWFREMNSRDIARLKDTISVFKIVTIHGQHLDLNIASCNVGIREESIRQYMECLELARKLDVEIVTFHMGRQTLGFIRSEDEILKYEIEFAEKAIDYARAHGIKVGYETGSVKRLNIILERFKEREFGVNIDLGHTAMQRANLVEVIKGWSGRIVEVHFNGVVHYWGGFMEHVPVEINNVIDYRKVIPTLKEVNFSGPIICEIQGNDIEQYIERVLEAKELITFLWKRADELPTNIKPWKLLKIIRAIKKR